MDRYEYEMVDDQIIALLACYISHQQLNTFAREGLQLSELQINNASGEKQSTVVDLHVNALNRWIDRNDDCCVRDLQKILTRASASEQIDCKVLEILRDEPQDEELNPRYISRIARRINSIQWEVFATGYLGIDMTDVKALMPLNNVSISTSSMGILRTWRNVNGTNSTIKQLRGILEYCVKEAIFSKDVLTQYQKIIGEKFSNYQASDKTSVAFKLHKTSDIRKSLTDNMDREVVGYLSEQGVLDRGQTEYATEFQHRKDCVEYVLTILCGRNSPEDISVLQNALQKCGQDDLAAKLND